MSEDDTDFPLIPIFQNLIQWFEEEEQKETFVYETPENLEGKFQLSENSITPEKLEQNLKELMAYIPGTARKDFFNQLFGGREKSAVLGEMLAGFLNSSMYTYKIAGVMVHIEKTLIRKLCELCGFTAGDGGFFPGGSLSNLCALLAARSEYFPESKEEGIYARRPTIYTSEESHYSIIKNAGIAGMGRKAVRFVPTDEAGKMCAKSLERMILEDRKDGFLPFFICATAGTTVLGVFDPIEEITEIADRLKLWVHVDGAFGGGVLFSKKHRSLMKGVEKADSVTFDAHKMISIPLICSVALFKKSGAFRQSLSENADYLFQGENLYNPGMWHIQCGRKNDALKLWSFWKFYGHTGLAEKIEVRFRLAKMFADKIAAHPEFELLQAPESLNVCFSHPEIASEKITKALNEEGLAKVGHGSFREKSYIRAVFVNPQLTEKDLENFMKKLEQVVSNLKRG